MPKSDDIANIAAKYNRVEKAADSIGRVIGVRRLKPSQRTRVEEMSPALTGDTQITTPDGGTITVPNRALLLISASVCEIDGIPIQFPRNRSELDSIMDRLDDPGFAAAAEAFGKFEPPAPKMEDGEPSLQEQVKNEPGTTD